LQSPEQGGFSHRSSLPQQGMLCGSAFAITMYAGEKSFSMVWLPQSGQRTLWTSLVRWKTSTTLLHCWHLKS
jgi:hypothetical protein